MSQLTAQQQLETAIQRWVAEEEEGTIATDWIVITAGSAIDRTATGYKVATSESMPYHVATGLLNVLNNQLEDIYLDED